MLALVGACGGLLGLAGCGGSGSSHNAASYLYCTNAFSYDISQFKIQDDGSLTPLARNIRYTVNANGLPGSESLNFDPSRKHAYLANLGASTIDEYNVDSDATLSYFGSVELDQGANSTEPSIVVFSASGKYAYATSESRTNHKLTEFTVRSDGALVKVGSIDTGNDVGHIVVDPLGRFLYVTSYFGNTISRYPINADGTLSTAITPLPTGAGPFAITQTPNAAYVYVTNLGTLFPPYIPVPGSISEYSVGADGSLTSIGTINAGTGPGFLTVSPDSKFAYVGNLHDTSVMVFAIKRGGTLALIQTLQVGNGPVQVTFSPNGRYAYVALTGANLNATGSVAANSIQECTVNADGTLTPFGLVPAGAGPDYMLANVQ